MAWGCRTWISSVAPGTTRFVAELGPAGMIFVPCEGGISHNEIENAAPDDLAAGCAVLLRAMLAASVAVARKQLA